MKILILYDSFYGNTEKIAEAIGSGLVGDIKIIHVKKAGISQVKNINLLVVGSPTHGGMPTPSIAAFLKTLPDDSLAWVNVAAFDTRFATEDHGIALKIVMNVLRFAAGRIVRTLKRKGGIPIAKPEGFIVEDKEGPLKKGELERAKAWAKRLQP